MQISWLKAKGDSKSFKIEEKLGLDVLEIQELDNIDKKIDELIEDNYHTIVISNELAGFSQNIIKKYVNNPYVKIFIAPRINK